MTIPERVQIADPTGETFLDYLEVRLIQSLAKEVGRNEKPRLHAFAMGLATARWIYLLQYHIPAEQSDPIDYVATVTGRLASMSVVERALIIREQVDVNFPQSARATIQQHFSAS